MARNIIRTSPDAVQFQEEPFEACMAEHFAFVHSYWDDAPENANERPLQFDTRTYEALSGSNMLRIIVGRYYGKMVASALYVVNRHPHYAQIKAAQCDIFAIAPEWRGQGLGQRMMEHVIEMMRRHGVDEIANGFRTVFDGTVPLFEKLGFEPYERWYRLALTPGDETEEGE